MRYYRKVIKIRAEDSPNVQYAELQLAAGLPVTNEILVPGVLTHDLYRKRRETWDKVRQFIGLDAEFWEGADVLLYPPDWLDHANRMYRRAFGVMRKAKAIGIDPAEGGDSTAMSAVDEIGLIEQVSKKTPNTAVITSEALAFMRKHEVPPEMVGFDRGGGGQQHADRLREQGYPVRTIAFGEPIMLEPKRGLLRLEERIENREERYTYFNKRAQMYGRLSVMLDPSIGPGYSIPEKYYELRRQMAPIPVTYDENGRLRILPKNAPADSNKMTLTKLIGCSPDELDSLVIAIEVMVSKPVLKEAGAI